MDVLAILNRESLMTSMKWIIAAIALLGGLILMVNWWQSSRRLYFGQGATLAKYLISSALAGAWACLLLLGFILAVGAFDLRYEWKATEFIGAIVFSLMLGFVTVIGSLWSYFVVGKFREALLRWLQKRRGG